MDPVSGTREAGEEGWLCARRRRRPATVGVLLSVAVFLLAIAPSASADTVICGPGTDPEDCQGSSAVAVDRSEGILYVADNGNEQVDAFDAETGAHLDSFNAGVSLGDIAVDNDAATPSPALGDVYVIDATNGRVLKLRPTGGGSLELVKPFAEGAFTVDQAKLGVGPEGVLYVADSVTATERRLQQFDHEGNELLECSPLVPDEGQNLLGLAVDSTGDFYLAKGFGVPVRKYDSECNVIEAPPFDDFHLSFNVRGMITGAADELLVGDIGPTINGQATPQIYRYDAAGTMEQVLYGNGILRGRPVSLVPFSSPSGDVFAAEPTSAGLGRVVHFDYPPPGPVVHPNPALTSAQEPVQSTRATLTSQINPEGEATEYGFQYVDDATFQASEWAGAEETPPSELVPPAEPAFAPPLFRLAQASAQIGCAAAEAEPAQCLVPETTYHFRAFADNAASPEPRFGPKAEFETGPAFDLIALWSSQVGAKAARIHAQVNPLGSPATGTLEYVDEAGFEASGFAEATQVPVDFGSSEASQTRSAQLHELDPDTTYRYRVVVTSGLTGKEEELEGSFSTFPLPSPLAPCPNDAFRSGSGSRLPDCRAYEMVTPVDKEGGDAFSLGPGLNQGAATVPAEGRGLTYSSYRAFSDPDSSPILSQYLARRSPDTDGEWDPEDGWSNEPISPPREGPAFNINATGAQYKAFSEDLATGWLRTESEPPLTEDAIEGFLNLYRRDNATGAYQALCPTEPPSKDGSAYTIELAALSGDGQTAAINGYDNLTPEATGEERAAYACRAGQLELVSVLPGGEANPGVSKIGTYAQNAHTRLDSTHNAVSADGERIYWTDNGAENDGPGRIFLRERPFATGAECGGPATPCTLEVSEAAGGAGSQAPATYWTASPDGERAIFSFASGALEGNLYAFDATATTELLATGVSGLAGWSEDAMRIYLVSDEDLDEGGPGEAGTESLYLHDVGAESTELVAALPGGTRVGNYCDIATRLAEERCWRTTADGLQLAFMSQDPLTGYDNTDLSSPAPCGSPEGACDAEVFLFDATATGEKLRCVSCNPSGQRPSGRNIGGSIEPTWIASRLASRENSFRAQRELSADGRRLFFESFDALVPTDTNGAQDVYQWEAPGKGTCTASRPEFVASAGGCVELISSGRDRNDSSFLDASANGSDVFLRTSEGLLPQDPGSVDIYDARSGGGLPVPPPPRPPCEGESCQSPPSPPDPPDPASGLYAGPGNIAPQRLPRCRRPARAAKRMSRKAKRARRAARRADAPARRRALRRRAKGMAKGARKQSVRAKRCRARARASRGVGR